jgi:ribosomal-protein-alanine N-acetyltransferase
LKLSFTAKVPIRPARREDLQEVLRVEYKCFKDPYPMDLLIHLQETNPLSFLVAEVGGSVIGYIIGTVRWMNVGHVLAIGVDPQHRRKGVGTTLMERLIDYFRKRGVSKVRLEARESNWEARKFYSSLGFSEVGKVPYYYSDGETAILFEREI